MMANRNMKKKFEIAFECKNKLLYFALGKSKFRIVIINKIYKKKYNNFFFVLFKINSTIFNKNENLLAQSIFS